MHNKDMILKQNIKFVVVVFSVLASITSIHAGAQPILGKKININLQQSPIQTVFREMEKKGNFVFSYNTTLIPRDSLVSLKATELSVLDALKMLFQNKYQYLENKNFLVITPSLRTLQIITKDVTADENTYAISGVIVDEVSGERLMNVSVYEKQSLAATLSDEHGYFKLKIKTGNSKALAITASKIQYKDAVVNFLQTVAVSDRSRKADYQRAAENSMGVEKEGLGRFMIGARQKIQSLNIPDFFAKRPFQISITPGLSTHGLMSSQVVNKFSINLAGGYTAGVKGLEIGGLFNINRFNSKYVQLAGVFNMVGGTMTGFQFAGISNKTLDSVRGVQLAPFLNKAGGTVAGLQLSGLNNEAHVLKGVQIGLINVADSSAGASIGLINIIRNGFYKVSLSANDAFNTNLSLTTGTHRFYTTIHAGTNFGATPQKYALGISVGHDFMLSDKAYLSAIVDYQIYGVNTLRENWKQAKLLMNVQLSKNISLFAGPTFRRYTSQLYSTDTNVDMFGRSTYGQKDIRYKNNVGWEAGVAFNSLFKPAQRITHTSENWFMGLAANAGAEISGQQAVMGGSVFAIREFNDRFAATLSVGYNYFRGKEYTSADNYYGTITNISTERRIFSAIPIKAGIRTYTGKHLFFFGELGFLYGLSNPNYTTSGNRKTFYSKTPRSPIIAAGAGYDFGNGLEAKISYDGYLGQDMQLVNFSLAYKFKL
jgi:hypothetical protein